MTIGEQIIAAIDSTEFTLGSDQLRWYPHAADRLTALVQAHVEAEANKLHYGLLSIVQCMANRLPENDKFVKEWEKWRRDHGEDKAGETPYNPFPADDGHPYD